MRIAYLTQSYPPMISGAALVVEKLASAMAKRGHQVLVIAASDREQPYIVQHQNLTVLRLNSYHNPLRVNQRILLFPHFAVLKALKKFRPDIIHCHEPLQLAWAGIAYTQQTHIPITLTVHQVPAFAAGYLPNLPGLHHGVESLLWVYAQWLLKKFSAVITPSQTISKLLASVTGIKCLTVSNGIDLQTFYPPLASNNREIASRKKWRIPPDVPIILHVGRLDHEKQVDRILKACVPVVQITNAHLLIVGDGCEKNNLLRLSRELDMEERVHFAGFVSPQNGLPEIYRMANLFVTASEIETQGIVLLEAAASGLPIVAVNATCISEIVHDRINGYLLDREDINTFSNALITLIDNPKMAKNLGLGGRILAEDHDIHQTWSLHEKLYRELILRACALPTAGSRKALKGWIGLVK